MKNGEILYKKLKLGEITKSQLTEQQKGDLYQYMVDSKKVTLDMIKPEVAQKYNLSVTPTPSRSPDTNAPIITPTYTPTHIPSRSPDTNAINYQPPKSTTPEMELVDILSNITMPTRGRTTQHERQQGSAYTPKPIIQSTPTDLTLADRVEQGIKGIGYNWAGGNLSSIGTIASIGSDIEVNHRPESSFISPKDFYPNNPEYKDNRIAETLQLADKLLAKGSEHTAKGREGLGTAGGVAYDILTGAGQMGADIGTAAVTGVGMLPVLGTRVFGQGASEARQSGADIGQQIAYGAISAGIEIATEKLVGGLPMAEKLGMGGVADNTIKKLAQGIASSPRLAKAFTYIANMAGEGAEEMIAEILSPVAKKMTYDPNADWATIEEVLYSGLLGAGISGVMGGGVLLQGNNQTPTETPTKTQSVMTNENIEPDIQGFQSTIDTGLNQLYSVLDSGQKNEQAINTMVTNLEKVKQLVPVLSNYVDSHIERLNSYKVIEQPQTNETNKVEQSIEQDTNVAQIERNDVIDGTEQAVDDNKTIDNIIPIDELRQKEILQDSNNIVTETKQKKTFIDDDLTFKIPNKLNVDNPFLENTYHPFNMPNERERQRERQNKWLNDKLQNMNTIKLSKPYEEERKQYAIVTPSIKDGKYQITVFDNDDTPVMDSQRNTIKEVVEELDSQGFTYIEEIDVQATEQPTTNETIPAEQIVEEDKYVVKKGDYVKIDGIGIGIATRDKNVAIGGKDYYRDSDSTDVSKVTAVEYWQDLQRQINELKTKAKEKRKEAADYNKETGGMATKRKGKISMGDGRGVGFAENSVSAHHRKLLNEAKEFTDKANQLSNLVDERKAQLENRVKNNIPFNKEQLAEAEILGVKVEEDKSDIKTEDKGVEEDLKTDVAKKETTEKQTYRYYLTQRPPSPGTFPKGTTDVVSFDTKQEVDGLEAWGYVEYDKPLTEKQIDDYELTEKDTETSKQPKKVTIRERIPSNELSTTELVQRVKAMGKDAQSSYGLFVKERDLKPEIDSKEFNEIFNRVSQNEHIKTKTVDFTPTHKYLGKDVMVTDIGSKYEFLSENGSTGTEFKPLRKEFVPIQETENVTETKQVVAGKRGTAKDNEGNAKSEDNAQVTLFQSERKESPEDTRSNSTKQKGQGKTTEQIIDKDDIPPQFQGDTPQSEKDKVLGIVPPGFDITPTPITEKFTYNTPELERQYKNNRITKQGKISKFKELASEFKKAATRTHRELDVKNSDNAEILKELIRYPKIKSIAGDEATRILTDIVQRENKKLSKEEYSRFERFVFLSDLMEEIELGHEMPGLWTEDSVRSNYEKLKQSLTPNIEEALERRKEYWNNIVKDYTEAMSEIGYDVSGRFTKENYFRHQVLEYVNAKQLAGSGGKAKVKTNRGYIKTRQGTQKAINEDYFQAEYEVLATMLYDKEVAQMLKRIDNNYGIKNDLMEQAKEKNAEIRENNKKLAMEAIKGNKELEDTYKELKGKEKADFIKQYAGDEYKEANFTWRDFIPDDYEIWQPIPGKHMFTVNTVSETFAEAIIQEALNELSPKDMRVGTALAIGQDKEQFVLPSRVAKSLDNTYNKLSSQDDIIHKILSYPMSLWKSWVLTVNPRQVVKYNLRNITGDIDGLMASAGIKAFNPKLVGRATKELFNAMRYGKFTKDLLEFRNRGGYSDLMYAQELGEIYETKSFKIYNQADTNSILRNAIKKMPGLKTYTDFTENATNWRESILRYSAYLYFKEDLKKNNGKPTYYGASTRERIDGLKTIEDKAYQLSKDALGSYDEITEVGQALKKYLIPFHSWNEVNMKRYKRVFENTIADIKQQEEIGKQFLSGLGLLGYTSIHGTRLIGKMAIRVFFASALLMAWNRLVKPDDDDELPDDIKNTPHLTLGRDEKGNIIYFSRLGALNEVLDWFNLDQIIPDLKEIANERKTIEEQAKDMAIAPLNKIVNSISPFIKTPVELLSNSSYYPDIRHPRTIRDKNYYIFNSFGLGEEYRRFAGLPTETSYAESWQKALIYKSNPEVNAYYKAIDLKYKFEKNVLKQDTGRFLGGSEKSEALYYYKQALKYDDKKAANKYLKKYYELGGTDRGLKQSLASLNPLYGLVERKGEREQFREWLTEDERKILDRAMKYYEDLLKQE